MKTFASFVAVAVALLAVLPSTYGQSVTGQISGTLADSSGGALVGAAVRLTAQLTQQERTYVTTSNGSFTFTNLVPGNYSIRVTQPGFKAWGQNGITVSAQERVDAGAHRWRSPDYRSAR